MAGLGKENLNRIYRDFLRVCEQWPVDKSRVGRDFGEQMRTSVENSLKQENFQHATAERTIEALAKISSNYYREKYPRAREIGYTTQDQHVYQQVLSNDGQAQVMPHRTWWERLSGYSKIGERSKAADKK